MKINGLVIHYNRISIRFCNRSMIESLNCFDFTLKMVSEDGYMYFEIQKSNEIIYHKLQNLFVNLRRN